ncbi:MAG: DUF2948 family protein [Pseudomonadota bacterium]
MADLKSYKPLRLIAADAEDLQVVSAVLQDAVAKVGDFAHDAGRRRFAFVANRFVWECAIDRRNGPFARVRAGVHFDDVVAVQQMNVRLDAKDAVVDILAVAFEAKDDGGGVIMLELAGGGAVRLVVESVNAQISDLTAPWPTGSKPDHGAAHGAPHGAADKNVAQTGEG